MSSVGLIARADLRRRWRELVLIGMLVALTSGVAMAAVVAAERANTSVDRFLATSKMSTADVPIFDVGTADRLIEGLHALPDVETMAVNSTLTVFVGDDPSNGGAGFGLNIHAPDPTGAEISGAVFGIDIDRPLILEGRLPRSEHAEEILLYEWISESMGLQVGDRLTGQTFGAADAGEVFGDGPFPGFSGPTLDLVVVGIGRSGREIAGEVGTNMAAAYGSEQLAPSTREALWWPPGVAVRTRNGSNEFDLFSELEAAGVAFGGAEFGGEFVGGVTDVRSAAVQTATNTVDTMAVGLAVLAAGVAAAGMIVIGQAIVRHVAGAARMRVTLFQLGESRRATASAITIPVLATATVGVVVGAVSAIAASARLPTGLARRAEVDPGVWVRPDLIVPIGAAAVLFATGFCFLVAVRRTRPQTSASAASVAGRVARLDPPPAVGAGVRLALDRGRGPRSLPIRSAFIALAIGATAVTAALVIANNVHELTTTPARWGWNWSRMPDDAGDSRGSPANVAAEPGVTGVGFFAANGVSVDGAPVGGFAIEQLAGDLEFTVRDGRLPDGPGEVALGARTLRRLDVAIGDTVAVADFGGANERTMTVVGTAVFPFEAAESLDDGAALLPATLFELTDEGTAQRFLIVRYDDDADSAELEAVLAAEHGLVFDEFNAPRPPAQVRNLSIARQMAVALAVFFAALGALALTHAIVVSSRRRRLDLAVLRALGFVRRQVRVAFLTQSLVFGAVAAAVGVPLGLVVGGGIWRAVTDDLGAVTSMTVPWPMVLAVFPTVLVAAALVSWWPGRAASRQDPTDALRAE